jgi:putative acetyltransferase
MIRKATAEDFSEMTKIWLEASIKAHDFMPESFWESKVNDMQTCYLPSSKNYVSIDHNNITGFISMADKTIAALFVSPSSQGKGIGSKLINFIKNKSNELELCVYKSNAASISFYKKHDFLICDEKIDEQTGHPELIMKLNPNKTAARIPE